MYNATDSRDRGEMPVPPACGADKRASTPEHLPLIRSLDAEIEQSGEYESGSDEAATPKEAVQLELTELTGARALAARIWDNGVVCMVITAAVFALSSFCVKSINGRLSVFQIVLVRSLCSWIITILSIRRMAPGSNPYGSRGNFTKLAARGVSGAAAMTVYYISIQLLPLGDAVTIFFTNVAVTSVAAYLFGFEKLSWYTAAGCLASIGGVVLVSHPPFIFGGGTAYSASRLWGVLAGLASSVFASTAFLAIRALGSAEKPIVMTTWFHTCAGLSSLVPLLAGVPIPAQVPTPREAGLLAGIVATSFFGQLLISRGFQLLAPSSAAAINLTQVVHAHLLSIAFLHEELRWYSIAGSALTALGVMLVQANKSQRANQPVQQDACAGLHQENQGGESWPCLAKREEVSNTDTSMLSVELTRAAEKRSESQPLNRESASGNGSDDAG